MVTKEYCVRCGGRFKWEEMRSSPSGSLFCPDCWKRIDARHEVKRACPADGAQMEKRLVAETVLIDTCPKCGGTWFDAGELRVVMKKSEDEGWGKGFLLGWLVG